MSRPCLWVLLPMLALALPGAAERQMTFTPKNHDMDNNDNFSPDGRWICYDTRDAVGYGIGNSLSIEVLDTQTGEEKVLYAPANPITGEKAAPGAGAVSFSPVDDTLVFIHGPQVDEVAARGYYDKPNRTGASVSLSKPGELVWLDKRDIATDRLTLPGAHRGGTHRHEYSLDGKRIGFTYDDFLCPQYDRTVGYMETNPKAPAPATHFFAIIVPVVPKDTAKPGEIEKAYSDSWVGREGLMRAFIGKVRNDDGKGYTESLFVADIPADVDITTADSGDATHFPSPPKGIAIRRLTHTFAAGVVRGSQDGKRIAYYAKDQDGRSQVFVIPSNGNDQARDPALRPVQVTFFEKGGESGLRWHPSGNSILCVSGNAIYAACVVPGLDFGKAVAVTGGDAPARTNPVFSPDGKQIAYNRLMPVNDSDGNPLHTYNGADFKQIFLTEFPDSNGDGIAD